MRDNETPYVFCAYPSAPPQLRGCIEGAITQANGAAGLRKFVGWPDNDIAGRPLSGSVQSCIEDATFLVADVTLLNFNVTYEIGYAIGLSKRVYLTRNETLKPASGDLSKVGIFDTLGYVEYTDASSLATHLGAGIDIQPLEVNYVLDKAAPVYVVETPHRTDAMTSIVARTKKARLQYRSFSPTEEIRMAATDAIRHISASHGVIVPLLSDIELDTEIHNIRAAFVAGVAHGLRRPTLILQHAGDVAPLDIRDDVKTYHYLEDIETHVNEFALEVVASMQAVEPVKVPPSGTLAQLSIGDSVAENEFQTLEHYYLRGDEFTRTLRGEVNVVVGRKGTGKTALFSQVRNDLRRNPNRVVVDLKPEGYQLVKLREAVLDYLTDGAKAHLLTAFWEYILTLEVAYKLLEKDRVRHVRDHEIRPHYLELRDAYHHSPNVVVGDFSERLWELSSTVCEEFVDQFGPIAGQQLTSDEVTEIIHSDQLRKLRDVVSGYVDFKDAVWVLFDNLDKGWSVPGPSSDDILILRCLIDAARKMQREMQRRNHDFHCVVFIRNDVYQLLMEESPDFGKEMRVSLDWRDAELLREMLRRRLVLNGFDEDTTFHDIWPSLCISHYKAEETSQYMIDRCLMRPRNLLKIFNHCKASAVNFGRSRIDPQDIEKGVLIYSTDLLIEADQELANIEPTAKGIIYHFMGEDWKFSRDEVEMLFGEHELPTEKYAEVIGFLLYFGFFGLKVAGSAPLYIFDVGYDMKQLVVREKKQGTSLEYALNPAFWPALGVGPTTT